MAGPNYFKCPWKRRPGSEHPLGGILIIIWVNGPTNDTDDPSLPGLIIENIKDKTYEDIQQLVDAHFQLTDKKLQFKEFERELNDGEEYNPAYSRMSWARLMDETLHRREDRDPQRILLYTEPIAEAENSREEASGDAGASTAASGT